MARVGAVDKLKSIMKASNPVNNNSVNKVPNKPSNISKIVTTTLVGSSRPHKTAPKIDLFA